MQKLTKEQRISLESQTARYQSNLYVAEGYLAGRGISEDTAVSARLGVVDEPIHGDTDAPYNRLSIPFLTRSGVVDIRYRCTREHNCSESGCSKYLGRPGGSLRIYGVEHLVSAASAVSVTEGELDALTIVQLGYPAVGLPGAQSWKPHWRRLFEDFNRIFVFGDGDEAGRHFARSFASHFPQTAEIVYMEEGEDVNSIYMKEGDEYFNRILG